MSSFGKNIIPRREHRERSQPASRIRKHGLLEKKKDYKLRAKDRNRKRYRVKLLREKAAFRNPDEFYFGMAKSITDGGRVRRVLNENEKDAIPIANRDRDQQMLAETQDSRYVTVKYNLEQGRVEKLKKGLHFLSEAKQAQRNHIIFVDDEEEMNEVCRNKELNRDANVASGSADLHPNKQTRLLAKEREKSYKEFNQRVERQSKLKSVLEDMSVQKAMLSKGRRFRERPADPETGAPAVYKWRKERRK